MYCNPGAIHKEELFIDLRLQYARLTSEQAREGGVGGEKGEGGEGKERVSGLMDTLCTVPRGRGGPGSAPEGRWHP